MSDRSSPISRTACSVSDNRRCRDTTPHSPAARPPVPSLPLVECVAGCCRSQFVNFVLCAWIEICGR